MRSWRAEELALVARSPAGPLQASRLRDHGAMPMRKADQRTRRRACPISLLWRVVVAEQACAISIHEYPAGRDGRLAKTHLLDQLGVGLARRSAAQSAIGVARLRVRTGGRRRLGLRRSVRLR
jgi:hypothetical protein